MRITVNGKPREIEAPADAQTIALPEFLRQHAIDPRLVAIAINGDVVPKDAYDDARIHHGDAVEVVRIVGGGGT